MTEESTPRGSRGIQSIEVGGQLLHALAHAGRPLALKDLAREADMTPAKAHPYLVSFGAVGLVEQEADTGRYGLGPLALQLGLIALQQVDPVRLASAELPALAREVGHTVAIAVWGNRGPTIVRLEEGPQAVHVNMRHGTVVSVNGTASGLLFAAHRDLAEVDAVLRGEAALAGQGAAVTAQSLAPLLARVRAQGWSSAVDGTVPGVTAVAAPVFDGFGQMVLALTAIGPSATLDARGEAEVVRVLRERGRGVSARLGWRDSKNAI